MKLSAVFLSPILLLVTAGPLLAAGGGPLTLVKTTTALKEVFRDIYSLERVKPTSLLETTIVHPGPVIETFSFANLGSKSLQMSFPEKILVYDQQAFTEVLSKEDVSNFLKENNVAEINTLNISTQDFIYLNGLPEQVLEKELIPSSKAIEQATDYYRQVLHEPCEGTLSDWAKKMAALTNLGLFGTPQDVELILDTVKSFRGTTEEFTDILASRALFNLGGTEAVQKLADFRANSTDSEGNPLKMSYVWGYIQTFVSNIDTSLQIDSSAISDVSARHTRRDSAEIMLGKFNPYNVLFVDPDYELSEHIYNLRKILKEQRMLVKGQEEEAEQALQAPKRYESPFSSFLKEDWELPQTPRVVETPQRPVSTSSSGTRLSYNELYYKALDLGLPRERIEALNYQQLAAQIGLTERMLKNGKIRSRYDDYLEANQIPKEDALAREQHLIEWAKSQPDFFYENYTPSNYTVPFNKNAGSIHVLMINDDTRLINDVLTKASNNPHFTFEIKKNVLDAFELLKNPNNHYDIVLTDFNTNAGNPLEVAMYAHSKNMDTKFVMYSLADGTGPWLYQYNIVAQFSVYEPVGPLLNFLSNIAVTGRAFPKP